jgi:hypothetical protein
LFVDLEDGKLRWIALYASLEFYGVTCMCRWGTRNTRVIDRGVTENGSSIEGWSTNAIRAKLFLPDSILVITDGILLGSTIPDEGNEGS